MDEKFTSRCMSFINSLTALGNVRNRDITDDFVLSGTVHKFSLSFDISWKIMKDIVVNEFGIVDFATGSPREVLKKAMNCSLIKSDAWIDMMNDRNLLTHDYDGNMAKEKIQDIINVYLPLMEEFRSELENRYM